MDAEKTAVVGEQNAPACGVALDASEDVAGRAVELEEVQEVPRQTQSAKAGRVHGTVPECWRRTKSAAPRRRPGGGHVEVEKAYYSVPPEYLARPVWVRWDARLVRIFDERMKSIAVHVKHEPGRLLASLSETIQTHRASTTAPQLVMG